MKRFVSLIAIPAIAALGLVALPAAAGTSPGVHNGALVHLTAAESPAASQPCEPGYSAWADYYTGAYIVSHNVQDEDLNTSSTSWSCWNFPDRGTIGEIRDEAGYCAEYHDSYVVSAVCSGIPAQGWDIEAGCYSGQYTATSYWAEFIAHSNYLYMNESGGGTGDLINLAAPCYEADNWHPVAVL
jgi:hypothetical protein